MIPTVGRAGAYQAVYSLPGLTGTDGYVSIKAQAADAAGNNVAQTILDAYSLSKPAHRPGTAR